MILYWSLLCLQLGAMMYELAQGHNWKTVYWLGTCFIVIAIMNME